MTRCCIIFSRMGLIFSPGLIMLNILKLVIIMYIRSWAVMVTNVPPKRIFKASHRFYLFLLLVMLFLCMLAVGYAAVEWVQIALLFRFLFSRSSVLQCCTFGLLTSQLSLKRSLSGRLFDKPETIYCITRSTNTNWNFVCFVAVGVAYKTCTKRMNYARNKDQKFVGWNLEGFFSKFCLKFGKL